MHPASTEKDIKSPGTISRSIIFVLLSLAGILLLVSAGGATLLWLQWTAETTVHSLSSTTQIQTNTIQSQLQNQQAILKIAQANMDISSIINGDPSIGAGSEDRSKVLVALQETLNSQTVFENLLVVKSDGLILAATQADWQNQSLPAGLMAKFSGAPTTLAVNQPEMLVQEQENGAPFLLLSIVPFRHQTGEPEAYLAGVYPTEFLLNNLQVGGPYSVRSHLVTADGKWFFIDQGKKPVQISPTPEQIQGLELSLNNTGTSLPRFISPFNPTVIRNAHNLAETGLIWEIEFPIPQLVFSWRNSLPLLIPILAGIFLVFALLLLIPYLLLRPLKHMARASASFADGNWEERIYIPGNNELGAIAGAFNLLAEEIQQFSRKNDAQTADHNDKTLTLAKISHLAATAPVLDEVIRPILTLTLEHLGYSYAAFYQVSQEADGSTVAILRQGFGAPAIEKEYVLGKIPLDSNGDGSSPISRAILYNRPQTGSKLRLDDLILDRNSQIFEAAIPMSSKDQVIGCLCVFSSTNQQLALPSASARRSQPGSSGSVPGSNQPTMPRVSPFTTVKIAELQIVANQLAMALHSSQNSSLNLSSRLQNITRKISALRQAEAQTSETEELQIPAQPAASTIDWTPEELSLIEAVSGHSSLAAEQAHLFEELKQKAQQEELLNLIVSKSQQSLSLDRVMKIIVQEIVKNLHISRASIRLGRQNQEPEISLPSVSETENNAELLAAQVPRRTNGSARQTGKLPPLDH